MSRIHQKLFICSILVSFIFTTSSEAKETTEPKPVPVLAKGTRLFPGDPKKNEFYVLGDNDPDPVIYKKGPAYINMEPLAAGIDSDNVLNANPEEILAADTPEFDEGNEVATQHAKVESPQQANEEVAVTNKSQPEQMEKNTNYSKVKALLHKLTQKIAEKKAHSKKHVKHYANQSKTKHAAKKHNADIAVIKAKFIG